MTQNKIPSHAIDGDLKVRVSVAMSRLRKSQTQLNSLLWSTEICYGHMLATTKARGAGVWDEFKHANTQAWVPNKEGNRKYDVDIQRFLSDVSANTRYLHRHVLISFYSSFEDYLNSRLGDRGSWGPFVKSLSDARLIGATYGINSSTILRAEFSRLIRNSFVHGSQSIPKAPNDAAVDMIMKKFEPSDEPNRQKMDAALTRLGTTAHLVRKQLNKFVHSVDIRASRNTTGNATHEFFYTLFTFTHLDALAFEIEEALFDSAHCNSIIYRKDKKVRNRAMKA